MGIRGSARISRGVWITGGPGFAGALLALRLLELGAIAIVTLVAGVIIIVIAATFAIWQSRDTARRKLAHQSLADGVDPEVVRVVAGRSEPPVWGVYLMGSDLYTGSHPKRQDTLARLYPHRSDLLCAALMPDAKHANAAARRLRQHGFSASELTRLFAQAPAAPPVGRGTARSEQPESARSQATGTTSPDSSQMDKAQMKSERDLTKYEFDGQVHGKGRLVCAVVRRYVADHPGASFEELRQAFPDELQASSALQFSPVRVVVARLSDIPQSETKRFFLSDGETLALSNSEVAVSREWNVDNIQVFLARAKKLGYEIAVAS